MIDGVNPYAELDKVDDKKEEDENVEEEEPKKPLPEPHSPWSVYFSPYWLTYLISKNKLIYGISITFWYLV